MNYELDERKENTEDEMPIEDTDAEDESSLEEFNYEEEQEPENNNQDKNDLKKKLIKLMIIIAVGMVILLSVLFLATTIFKPKYSYEQMEDKMKDAAISYFDDHKNELPQDETQTVEIEVATLVASEKMKSIDKYLGEGQGCSGKVQVKKVGEDYVYTPYLTCKKYSTQFLADTVAKDENLVGSGYGLYLLNNNYVFRGENVNNYVQLDAKMWRIVKVNSDKSIMLILNKPSNMQYTFDDRYNQEVDFDNGLNPFQTSRIREQIQMMYNITDDGDAEYILSEKDKAHIINTDYCVGKMNSTDTIHDNSIECIETISEKIGLLTVSDFVNASTDLSCNSITSPNCQNYNYLTTNGSFWLANPSTKNSYTVFYVSSGVVKETTASRLSKARPVITLASNTVISGGTGTEQDPYVIK